MFTYSRYQDAHPTHCISNLFWKKTQTASSRKQRFSSADTVLFRVLAAAPQASQANIPSSCTTRTKPRCWRSWSSKYILTTLHPDTVKVSLGSVCMQSLTQGSSLLWLCLKNFTPHPKKAGKQKGKKTKPPQSLASNFSSHSTASLHQNEFFHKCSPMTISPSAEQAGILPKKQHETPGWSRPTQLPSSLLFSQKEALWQSVSFCEITEINYKKCIFLAYWEDSKVFSSY